MARKRINGETGPGSWPKDVGAAELVKLFAEFLTARSELLHSLMEDDSSEFKTALRGAYSRFYFLANGLMPEASPEILSGITEAVILNTCRRIGSPLEREEAESAATATGSDGALAQVIELSGLRASPQEAPL